MNSSKPRRRITMLAVVLAALTASGAGQPARRELPDARTWTFFSERKVRSRLFIVPPGEPDSILVSDEPACCPEVAGNGRWAACTNFNRMAIENELLILSRNLDRWRPLPGYTAIAYAWSPDGLSLAGYGKRRVAQSVCFFLVDPVARSASIVDSLLVLEDYEFAWDSTSRRLAICRPGSGLKDPARLLLYSIAERKLGVVTSVAGGTLSRPAWHRGDTLVVTAELGAAPDSSVELRFSLPSR